MTYKEAKAYLQPIADNATLTGYREALCKAIEALEVADSVVIGVQPAADVAPVVHGRWHEKCVAGFNKAFCTVFVCSECAKRYRIPDMNYCPNCGAKMDVTDINVGHKEG